MKKNIMMRLAAFLLVAVLLSTSIIGGTWAKYTTSSEQTTETATVAKWGVEVTANAADNKEYQTVALSSEESAVLKTEAKLLAPGSGVKFGTFTVSGKPEVDVEVKYSAVVEFGTGWDAAYMPLVFKVGDVTLTFRSDGHNTETIADFADRIEAEVAKFSVKLDADATNDLNTKAEQYKLAVSCAWAFESENDAKDTALGNATNATVTVKLTCTVSQVDELN